MTLSSGSNTISGPPYIVKYNQPLSMDINYNVATGKYKVPETGTYLVSVTLMTGTVSGHATLMKNGVYVWIYSGNQYDMATQTVIMELTKGQEIWVEMANGHTLYGAYNTFTVVKQC
ncbi:Hypothetical predicted protein [Mytilus galloprovincialis]|uniref:C1q domain-containing protein n=1 Tax=Mytilus galloprovincialis TaxID=29158 RepID=A0A8B6C868_MYTGA|nr:Hypothetical predicted protein [Mytilus galloprovincialis]